MKRIFSKRINRRTFMGSAVAATATATQSARARIAAGESSDYVYEVTRSDQDWLDRLGPSDYDILRLGYTEPPKSSPLWDEQRDGTYSCKGCDLDVFEARWKVILDKGWVFFYHPIPTTVMLAIDGRVPEYGEMATGSALTEVHCRRCGCHLGHFVYVAGAQTHCINGASLTFTPSA